MKLTKSLLESLIREAMEEANCRGNELGEMNCGSKRDDDVMEEEAKPDFLDLDGDGDKEESMKSAAKDAKKEKEK
jgi:8-oxo-dGTP pyrophosphatase MutT (NUDIX family)